MSTKIYEAWRTTKAVDTFELVTLIRDALVPEVKASIKKVVNDWMAKPEETKKLYKETFGSEPYQDKLTPISCTDILKKLYKTDYTSPYKSVWDLNLNLTFRKSGNRHYIIPYYGCFYNLYDRSMVSKALNKIKVLEDYAYWNNTDMPDGMTKVRWASRRRKWDEFFKNWQGNYVTLEIMTPDSFFYLDPIWEEAWANKK